MSNMYERPEDAPGARERHTFGDGHVATAQQPMHQPVGAPPPMEQGYGYGYGHQPAAPWRSMQMRRQYPIETKPFFLTSEFLVLVLSVLGIVLTASIAEDVDARLGLILATAIAIGYTLSRGVAKSGTQSLAPDPREHVDFGRGSSD